MPICSAGFTVQSSALRVSQIQTILFMQNVVKIFFGAKKSIAVCGDYPVRAPLQGYLAHKKQRPPRTLQ